MTLKVNDRVIYLWPSEKDSTISEIRSGVIERVEKSKIQASVRHSHNGTAFIAMYPYLYPDTPESRQMLQVGIDIAARHKKENDEYFNATLEFNNDLVRKGLK